MRLTRIAQQKRLVSFPTHTVPFATCLHRALLLLFCLSLRLCSLHPLRATFLRAPLRRLASHSLRRVTVWCQGHDPSLDPHGPLPAHVLNGIQAERIPGLSCLVPRYLLLVMCYVQLVAHARSVLRDELLAL